MNCATVLVLTDYAGAYTIVQTETNLTTKIERQIRTMENRTTNCYPRMDVIEESLWWL